MSFVLDALKVSEKRRSKFSRPVYAHPPRPHAGRRKRRWITVLLAIAVVAGVFLAWRLLIQTPAITAVGGADSAGAAAPPAAMEHSGTPPGGAIGNTAQSDADTSSVPGNNTDVTGLTENEQSVTADPGGAGGGDGTQAAPPGNPPVEITADTAPPDWPPLTLQMLFHSPQGDRSFVQINGRSYREGERLDDGPEVVAIASDGVVLAYQGARVRLAMQR